MFLKLIKSLKSIKNKKSPNNGGYIAIINVIVVSAIVLLIGLSLVSTSTNNNQASVLNLHSHQAQFAANSCLEFALQNLRNDSLFVGEVDLVLADYSCHYSVAETGVNNWILQGESQVGDVTERWEVVVDQIFPQINIQSWQRVAEFQ